MTLVPEGAEQGLLWQDWNFWSLALLQVPQALLPFSTLILKMPPWSIREPSGSQPPIQLSQWECHFRSPSLCMCLSLMEFDEYGLKMLKMDCLSFIHASTMRSLSFSDRKRSHRLEKYCDNKFNHHGGLIWRWSSLPPEKTDLLQVLGLIETCLYYILKFTQQFPVRVIHQNKDSRSHLQEYWDHFRALTQIRGKKDIFVL